MLPAGLLFGPPRDANGHAVDAALETSHIELAARLTTQEYIGVLQQNVCWFSKEDYLR